MRKVAIDRGDDQAGSLEPREGERDREIVAALRLSTVRDDEDGRYTTSMAVAPCVKPPDKHGVDAQPPLSIVIESRHAQHKAAVGCHLVSTVTTQSNPSRGSVLLVSNTRGVVFCDVLTLVCGSTCRVADQALQRHATQRQLHKRVLGDMMGSRHARARPSHSRCLHLCCFPLGIQFTRLHNLMTK